MENSASRLEELIQNQPYALKEQWENVSLLARATQVAWVEGCEILWKHRSLLELSKELILTSFAFPSFGSII
jgi:hypothetical protein